MKRIITYASAIILLAFGMLTLLLSTSVIFDLFGIREMEGNYVPLIVWANFIVSLFYLIGAYGFFMEKVWTTKLLGVGTVLLILAFIYLIIHIFSGGIYEDKTVGAMIFRTALTFGFTLLSYFSFRNKK
ncbi:MAG TPA: hypothetical protein VKY37_06875 [Brumimicrobium sp.]|nr:hypothetical protein [Brumimicrobium sp.]